MKRKEENGNTFSFSIDKKELVKKVLLNMYTNSSIYLTRKYQRCQDIFGRSPI